MNLSVIYGLFITVTINIFLSHFVTPKPKRIWQRSAGMVLLEIATWLFCFSVCILIFRRVCFVTIGLISLELLLVLVNQAKFYSLKEAFIYQDFEYFIDMIKHPRLYLPFFGVWRTIFASGVFIIAILAGAIIEKPLIFSAISPECLFFIIISILIMKYTVKALPKIKLNPNIDIYELGQIAFFWSYWHAEKNVNIDYTKSIFNNESLAILDENIKYKNIVVIQSESFFDIRSLSSDIKTNVLSNFDKICLDATYSGKLSVPAFGADTVRTECGFLTGLTEQNLDIHKFNPYRKLSKITVPNVVSHLKKMGYYTVCIHPFSANFYRRSSVFPLMGFDEFIDIKSFDKEKTGQYIGDLTVADKIKQLLSNYCESNKPLFVFAITMENHGPLHLEKPVADDYNNFNAEIIGSDFDDLMVYLKHLKNADLMVKELEMFMKNNKESNSEDSLLCWYGDHVPIMSKVYDKLGTPSGDTDYFIWSTNTEDMSKKRDIHVHELAKILISHC